MDNYRGLREMVQYIIWKADPIEFFGPIIKRIYATGKITLKEMKANYVYNKFPDLFSSNFYCQVDYYWVNLQPSLWDKDVYY